MIKKLNQKAIWAFLFIGLPLLVCANDGGDGIEPPPPSAPIDTYTSISCVVALLIAAYFFYKQNLKIESK